MSESRDHGGGLDAAVAQYGGARADWLDLSTGINPVPYPVGEIAPEAWTALPDHAATERLIAAARTFWDVPDGAEIVLAPGASALIARLPALIPGEDGVYIRPPTYNEHAAAFRAAGFEVVAQADAEVGAQVFVHPNNPDGRLADPLTALRRKLTIIDESFCDVMPKASLTPLAATSGTVVLKSFGKFWGLAGLRLGFAICAPDLAVKLRELLGPWPVAGPALQIGARALEDRDWAAATRVRLKSDATRLDELMTGTGARVVGGTDLFRPYDTYDAAAWQRRLAEHHIWSRIFPYSKTWLRLGLPGPEGWDRLEAALR